VSTPLERSQDRTSTWTTPTFTVNLTASTSDSGQSVKPFISSFLLLTPQRTDLIMGLTFPYTYISCPCSDRSNDNDEASLRPAPLFHKHAPEQQPHVGEVEDAEDAEDAEEAPFDPRHPRAAYSLFPPEHLLYCEECRDIKCPRCIIEEQVSYFCTSCLFETPSSAVRSEGNR